MAGHSFDLCVEPIFRAMQLTLSEDQQIMRDSIRDFVEREVLPHRMEWDESQEFPRHVFRAMGEMGLMGMLVPEAYGAFHQNVLTDFGRHPLGERRLQDVEGVIGMASSHPVQPRTAHEEMQVESEWRAHAVTHGVAESWMPEVQVQVCDIGTS